MDQQEELPILGNTIISDNEPFSELYLMEFEEWYNVE